MSDDGVFDEAIARTYDLDDREMFTPEVLEPTVDFLAELAGDRRALEFAVGTGRVALALRAHGVEVAGIEMSRTMVDQMMVKPGADRIPVTIGDMATTRVEGTFGLVYLVYNTITNLLSQDEQVACFCNAAAHLEIGGHFVIEVFVPALRRLPIGERLVAFDVSGRHVGVDEYDVVNQRVTSHHHRSGDGRTTVFESPHRYAWPTEYDLMARIAGLTLHERWSSWCRAPFTAESTSHVSVWRRPARESWADTLTTDSAAGLIEYRPRGAGDGRSPSEAQAVRDPSPRAIQLGVVNSTTRSSPARHRR